MSTHNIYFYDEISNFPNFLELLEEFPRDCE